RCLWIDRTKDRDRSGWTALRTRGEYALTAGPRLSLERAGEPTCGKSCDGATVRARWRNRSDDARATCAGADNLRVRNWIAGTIRQQQGDCSTRGGRRERLQQQAGTDDDGYIHRLATCSESDHCISIFRGDSGSDQDTGCTAVEPGRA